MHNNFHIPWAKPYLGDEEIAFLPRHGAGHRLTPSEVNYRANLHALKQLGVTRVIIVSAVGSMKEEIEPGHLALPTQFIDRTFARQKSFFGEGVVAHVAFADPVCPQLHQHLQASCFAAGARVHAGGTYVCIEGPQFSTRAESELHRAWGGDLIGMTAMPEAKLAREAEICYALVALVTDHDCWRPRKADLDGVRLLEEIIANVRAATETSRNASITSGCSCTPVDIVKPGATQLTSTLSLPSSFASARVNATIAPFDVT